MDEWNFVEFYRCGYLLPMNGQHQLNDNDLARPGPQSTLFVGELRCPGEHNRSQAVILLFKYYWICSWHDPVSQYHAVSTYGQHYYTMERHCTDLHDWC